MTTRTQTRAASPVQTASSDRTVLSTFLLFVFIMGGASVAIRITYAEMAPFWAGASRFLLAGLVLAGVLIGVLLPYRKKPVVVEDDNDLSAEIMPPCA